MPLDPDVRSLLDGLGRLAFPPGAREDPQQSAAYLARARAALSAPGDSLREPVHRVWDEVVPGGVGVRVYAVDHDMPIPVVVYFHGGGWVSGGLEMNDALCRRFANLTGCILISVDYRLAPEHPYPAALDDCLAAIEWARAQAGRIGAEAGHVSVAGTSSGGNLAAAIALVTRDRDLPPLRAQLLLYPVLDHTMGTPSFVDNATGYLLEREQMAWYWDQYRPATEPITPYLAPATARDLSGLPAAVVVSAEFDPLRDEAEIYADRLAAEDTLVETLRFDGLIHGFLTFLDAIPAADAAMAEIARATRRIWTAGTT